MSLLRAVLYLFSLLAAAAVVAGSREEAELEQVRKRLDELKTGVAADLADKDRMSAELRAAETEIAAVSRELDRLRGERQEAEQRIAVLDDERERGLATMKSELAALAAQLRTAFASGRHERIKLLLNQQDPAVLGRMMVYYEYFSRMRRASIDTVSADLARVGKLSLEVSRQTRQLEALETEQERELEEMRQARERRAHALAALSSSIRAKGEEQARLEAQAATLEKLVEELREALKDFPLDGQREFASLKGDLAWPLKGTLLSDFGDARAGGRLRWRGVLIGAQAGDEVRAVYHGRVAYADWLPGMGLLVILDHGDGFMTLYGHNQSLFRSAGDWVSPGEVIAAVGNSGGLSAPSLYFEVREGTRPLNPHEWFSRPLARR